MPGAGPSPPVRELYAEMRAAAARPQPAFDPTMYESEVKAVKLETVKAAQDMPPPAPQRSGTAGVRVGETAGRGASPSGPPTPAATCNETAAAAPGMATTARAPRRGSAAATLKVSTIQAQPVIQQRQQSAPAQAEGVAERVQHARKPPADAAPRDEAPLPPHDSQLALKQRLAASVAETAGLRYSVSERDGVVKVRHSSWLLCIP